MDDESGLLLNTTHEYKDSKASDFVDWKSIKNKYEDIFVAELPDEPPSAEEKESTKFGLAKDFLHTKGTS